MTPEQINRMLAEQIMGFKRPNTIINLKGKYWHKPDDWIIAEYEWNPYTDIRQAFDVVEMFVEWDLHRERDTGIYICEVVKCGAHTGYGDTPSAAICEAAVEAIKDSDNPNNPKRGIDQGD